MLLELTVENYAVVEKVRVRFHRGLNLLTGETGSGKSIVVDALALLLGGRASAEMVRSGAERARIAGIFEMERSALPEGIELEDGELILEREILPNVASHNSLLKNVAWTPRPSEIQRETEGRGVHPTVFQQADKHVDKHVPQAH